MKTRFILLLIGLILIVVASIAQLADSDILSGSPTEIIATAILVVIGLVLIGFFAVKSVKAKLRYVQEARTQYNAAYLCMIQADPINTYMLVSTDTDIKLLTNDKKQTIILEMKKEFITIIISDVMLRGIRKKKGLTISTNAKVVESLNGENTSADVILLNDAKLLTPPLDEDAVAAARSNLAH